MVRLGYMLLLVVTLGLLAGPVVACICPAEAAPAMPCCPDEPKDFDFANLLGLPEAAVTACAPTPADLLPATGIEIPPAIASAAPPSWQTHGPPPVPARPSPPVYDTPPIYLVTLRLRN